MIATSGRELAFILADFGDPDASRKLIASLDPTGDALLRLGPPRKKGFRPIRIERRLYNPKAWLLEPEMSQVEFINGNPDHIRVRGIELRSGDIGIVELNSPGDGTHESFS